VRIISGKYKGRNLNPPRNLPVRPTTDFAKTGLFNVLNNHLEFSNIHCLDLFSGTGNISLELASRDCLSVISVDREKACVEFLKKTSVLLEANNIIVYQSDVFRYLMSCKSKFDLIFADPPFDAKYRTDIHKSVFENNLLNKNGILVIEHRTNESIELLSHFMFSKNYGNVTFSFFRKFDLDINANNP